ncbi:MAG: 3-deoxy-D-manno-octulosonic acid transferase [Deltaproteobacteria bacterium]|nr:3-deoxy-D-manno-octulosonic acid transferase [Deltaproteobacteria bacterium]
MKLSRGLRFLLGEYSLLWRAARPALRRHNRLKGDFPQRLVPEDWRPDGPVDLWIQAASGGEAFLARQLLGDLGLLAAEAQRRLRVLCTSCTRQGLDVLQGAKEDARSAWPLLAVEVRVFPLDEGPIMRRALDFASPRAVALLETELWPSLMAACAERDMPVLVLNGRMTEKSYGGYRWFGPLWRRLAPRRILAMDGADAARFAALFGYGRVSVMPNMKFDALGESPPGLTAESPARRLLPGPYPVVLLASVREEEETALLPVFAFLRAAAPEAVIVVAPRHMERIPAWERLLGGRARAGGAVLRSSLEREGGVAAAGSTVIWDAFGELTALYARCSATFVGGSLAPLGGQNFLEAAGQGRVPVVGPHWKNFAWVGEAFFTAGLGLRVRGAEELGPALTAQLHAAPDPARVKEKLAAYIASRRGGTRMAALAAWETAFGPAFE